MSELVNAELLALAIEELNTLKNEVDRRVKKAYQNGRGNGQAQYRAEIRKLRAHLKHYGTHNGECQPTILGCTCGLSDALKEPEGGDGG